MFRVKPAPDREGVLLVRPGPTQRCNILMQGMTRDGSHTPFKNCTMQLAASNSAAGKITKGDNPKVLVLVKSKSYV